MKYKVFCDKDKIFLEISLRSGRAFQRTVIQLNKNTDFSKDKIILEDGCEIIKFRNRLIINFPYKENSGVTTSLNIPNIF